MVPIVQSYLPCDTDSVFLMLSRQSGGGTHMDWAQRGFRDIKCGHEMTKAEGFDPPRSVPRSR